MRNYPFAAAMLVVSTLWLPVAAGAKTVAPDRGQYDPVDFMRQEGPALVDARNGRTHAIYRMDLVVTPGTPEAMAREALRLHADELGLSDMPGELVLDRVASSPGAWHVRFNQVVGGAPVFRGDVVVSISSRNGRVGMIQSNIDLRAPIGSLTPAIPASVALATGRSHLQLRGRAIADERADLRIYEGRLAWMANLPNEEPLGDWIVVVDAADGRVIEAHDQAVYIDGSGFAFDPDPLTTAEVEYGTPGYVDGSDADTPQLNAERFEVSLRDITFSSGLYRLQGPHCQLLDFEPPLDGVATSATADGFHFTRFQQGFEDALTYHHIDESQRHIQSLGYFDIQNLPIACDPHGLSGADNSHYLPGSNRLAWGEGGVDDAEDVDVILHEYGHAIQHGTVPGWGGGEEGSMGEGFGDYWAGSYSASISDYHSSWVFNWDGHNPFWAGRTLDVTWHYPEQLTGQVHHDGQIWSAALWKIYNEIGRSTTDFLVLGGHYYLGTFATMIDGAEAVVQAALDNDLDLHVDTCVQWFVDRGFLQASSYPLPSFYHTPLPDQGSTGPFTVNVTAFAPSALSEVRLVYGIDGVETGSVLMTPTGLNQYQGTIPDQGAGVVQYYIAATTIAGWSATEPRPAPYTWHTFEAGAVGVQLVGPAGQLSLLGARPNPFNPSTTIGFRIAERSHVALRIYDIAGRLVRTLASAVLAPGTHEARWDGRDDAGRSLGSGVYIVRMESGDYRADQRIVMLK